MASLGSGISPIVTPEGTPEFVNLDEKYLCLVCHNVCRDAMQTSCGHRFCEKCLAELFKKSDRIPCPAAEEDCLEQTKADIHPDRSGRREISRLDVYCFYKNSGCSEIVPWIMLEKHKSECQFRLVPCQNDGCTQTVPHRNLETHMKRDCPFKLNHCEKCDEIVPEILMEKHLRETCRKVLVACPYQCGESCPREEMEQHITGCANRPVECRFKSVGCDFVGTVTQVTEHMLNDVNTHLEKITLFTSSMDLQSMELRNQLAAVTTERDSLRGQVVELSGVVESVKGQIQALKTATRDLKMKMVSLTERTIHMERRSEDMAKKESVDKVERDIRETLTSITSLRDRVERLSSQGRGGAGGASAGIASVPGVQDKLDMHDQQLAHIEVKMAEMDLRFQVLETASYDGTLLWKLREYTRRKAEAVSGKTLSLYSQPFYTHRFGYKMCARVYLNGDGMGKGSHLSLFFVVMRGEYDNLLIWPFPCKVTMTLLDQETGQSHISDTFRPDPNSSSFRKPSSEMNIASGCPLFISHTVLETRRFIQDDTLFIKFEVDTSNAPHP